MLYIFFLFHQTIYTCKNNSVVPKLESVCSSSRKNWCNLLKIYGVLTISSTEKMLDFLLPFFSFVRLLFLLYILNTKFTCLFLWYALHLLWLFLSLVCFVLVVLYVYFFFCENIQYTYLPQEFRYLGKFLLVIMLHKTFM